MGVNVQHSWTEHNARNVSDVRNGHTERSLIAEIVSRHRVAHNQRRRNKGRASDSQSDSQTGGHDRKQQHPANAETVDVLKKTTGREHADGALSLS